MLKFECDECSSRCGATDKNQCASSVCRCYTIKSNWIVKIYEYIRRSSTITCRLLCYTISLFLYVFFLLPFSFFLSIFFFSIHLLAPFFFHSYSVIWFHSMGRTLDTCFEVLDWMIFIVVIGNTMSEYIACFDR